MYIPKAFEETDRARLLEFMKAHNFVTVTSLVEGRLVATHIPVTVWQNGDRILCRGHFAKANAHWRALESQQNLVIFAGPNAYVSPALYEKVESVPTWNYIAVHAYGVGRIVTDSADLRQTMDSLIQWHDPAYQVQWDSLSDAYRQGMMQGTVVFEMVLENIEGKFKLSQNRSANEQANVARALSESDSATERETGQYMTARLHGG